MKRPHFRGHRPKRQETDPSITTDVNQAEQPLEVSLRPADGDPAPMAQPAPLNAPQGERGENSPPAAHDDRRRQHPRQRHGHGQGQQADRQQGERQQGDRQQGDRQQGDRQQGENERRDQGNRRNRNQRGRQQFRGPRPQNQGGTQREEPMAPDAPLTTVFGILEQRKDNTAFLRRATLGSTGESTGDAFMGASLRPQDYRTGVIVTAEATPSTGRSPWTVRKITAIDGEAPENARNVAPFERGTVIDPLQWLKLETGKEPKGTRMIDLFCPIGKGTRGMIVAPPRSGKTILLKQIASAIVTNHKDVKLVIMLVDERPEEVTDFKRSVPEAEVWASSNDESVASHLDMARLVIARCKRMVERGQDVVMLLDSITRLARAFNAAGEGAKGRTMSGGMAAGAMQEPRAIFGASRCLEEGGSLTIIATALVETGSAMDELIFQEFKGTGNMELVLDRKLAEKRLFPAMDISASGTRKDEKLLDAATHKRVGIIRRYLSGMDPATGITKILDVMDKTDSNLDLLKKFEP